MSNAERIYDSICERIEKYRAGEVDTPIVMGEFDRYSVGYYFEDYTMDYRCCDLLNLEGVWMLYKFQEDRYQKTHFSIDTYSHSVWVTCNYSKDIYEGEISYEQGKAINAYYKEQFKLAYMQNILGAEQD